MTGQTVILSTPRRRQWAHQLVDAAPDHAVINIRPADRTTDQNAKMWAMLSDISKAKPLERTHTPEVWKALFMHACGYEVQFAVGLSGEPFPLGFRSSRLTKEQMSELIEFMHQWCTENGVALQ